MTAPVCHFCRGAIVGLAVPLVDASSWSASSSFTPLAALSHPLCLGSGTDRTRVLEGWAAIAYHCKRSQRWCRMRHQSMPLRRFGGMVRASVAELDAWLADQVQPMRHAKDR